MGYRGQRVQRFGSMCSEVHEVNLAGVIRDREGVLKGGCYSSLQHQGLADKPLHRYFHRASQRVRGGEQHRPGLLLQVSPAQGIKPTTARMTAACQNAGFPQT